MSQLGPTALRVAAAAGYILLCLAAAEGPLSGDDHYSLWAAAAALAGDRPNIDFFDPGSPLQWWLSYFGQAVSGGRPIAELSIAIALKTAGLIAVVAVSQELLGRPLLAWAAACIVTLTLLAYQVYGADKVFLYPIAVLAGWRYLDGRMPPWALGVLVGAAFLFRHDHGFYIGAFLAAVVMFGPRARWRSLLTLAGCALAVCGPWLLWIARTEGVLPYFQTRMAFSRHLGLTEARPFLRLVDPLWSVHNAAGALWHVALAVPCVAIALAWRRRNHRVLLASFLLVMMEAGIMRQALQAKETAILWVPLAFWVLSEVRQGAGAWVVRTAAAVAMLLVLIVTAAPVRLGSVVLDEGGLIARARRAVEFHGQPHQLDRYAPASVRNERLLVRYVAECLEETDRVWDTSVWFPLTYYANRRQAWHPYWELGFRNDEAAQRQFLAWVQRESVPVIIGRRREPDPLQPFMYHPIVRDYVVARYREVWSPAFARFVAEGNVARVFVDRLRVPSGVFEPLELPCFAGAPGTARLVHPRG